MENYTPCIFENKLNKHLSTCLSKQRCDYQKLYSGIRTPYCKKREAIENAERVFQGMKKKLEDSL